MDKYVHPSMFCINDAYELAKNVKSISEFKEK